MHQMSAHCCVSVHTGACLKATTCPLCALFTQLEWCQALSIKCRDISIAQSANIDMLCDGDWHVTLRCINWRTI